MRVWIRKPAWRATSLVMFLLLAVGGLLTSLSLGAVDVPLTEILQIVGGRTDSDHYSIIWNIRLPRTLIAALAGIGLSLSGALLQGILRNPMADPHIIGISSGAGLMGIMILLIFPGHPEWLVPSAFLGALLATLLIYLLAWDQGSSPMRILLSGVAVSALLNSGISGLFTFFSNRVEGAVSFMIGSLAAKSWIHVGILWPYTLAGAAVTLIGAHRMNILMLGEDVARSLGLNIERYRLTMVAAAALLAASSVSIVGLLSFVGLIVPHSVRLLVGSDYRLLLPGSALLGIAVLTLSDTAARLTFAPVELPVGIVMGVVGAPFFLMLLRKRKQWL